MTKIALLVGLLALSANFAGAGDVVAVQAGPFGVRIAALRKAHAALLEDIKKLDVSKLNDAQKAEKAVYDKDLAEMDKAFLRKDLKEEEIARFEKTLATHRKTVERHKLVAGNPLAARIAALRRDHAALIADIKKLDVSKLNDAQKAEKAVYDKDLAEVAKAFTRDIKDEELAKFEKMIIEHRKTVERHKAALKAFLKP